MEFGLVLPYQIYQTPDVIGIHAHGHVIDGINKHGLCVMAFYFPHYDDYIDITDKKDTIECLASVEVCLYLLQRATNLDDVKELIQHFRVTNEIVKSFDQMFPLHWFCVDISGQALTLEAISGRLHAYDNNLGIITNSPTFPEHLEILVSSNALSLSNINNPNITYSQGTGMLGLAGDMTSNSRFSRLFQYQKYHILDKTAKDGINTAFHILNNFDIVKGMVIDCTNGNDLIEYTQYMIVYNLNQFNAHYKTYDDHNIQFI